jgi:hypothetical protein
LSPARYVPASRTQDVRSNPLNNRKHRVYKLSFCGFEKQE